jgi:hypothetical protein
MSPAGMLRETSNLSVFIFKATTDKVVTTAKQSEYAGDCQCQRWQFGTNRPKKPLVKKPVKKPRQIRFYLLDETPEILDEIGKRMPELSETDIVRIHLYKALRATREAGYRLSFPFEFKIVHPEADTARNATAGMHERGK